MGIKRQFRSLVFLGSSKAVMTRIKRLSEIYGLRFYDIRTKAKRKNKTLAPSSSTLLIVEGAARKNEAKMERHLRDRLGSSAALILYGGGKAEERWDEDFLFSVSQTHFAPQKLLFVTGSIDSLVSSIEELLGRPRHLSLSHSLSQVALHQSSSSSSSSSESVVTIGPRLGAIA